MLPQAWYLSWRKLTCSLLFVLQLWISYMSFSLYRFVKTARSSLPLLVKASSTLSQSCLRLGPFYSLLHFFLQRSWLSWHSAKLYLAGDIMMIGSDVHKLEDTWEAFLVGTRRWETEPTKLQGPVTSVKFLEGWMSLFPGESEVAILWTTYNEKRGKMLGKPFCIWGAIYTVHTVCECTTWIVYRINEKATSCK